MEEGVTVQHQEFVAFAEQFITDVRDTLQSKGANYSAEKDRLSGFKSIKAISGVTELQGWLVLVAKHLGGIERFAATGAGHAEIYWRFVDLAAYSVLGAALVEHLYRMPHTEAFRERKV